jgi:hypothetical protein
MADKLSKLRPVTFRYKAAYADGSRPLEYGLISEEVAEVMPELVVYQDGKPQTVKYQLLATLLLQQMQERRTVDDKRIAKLEATVARLSKAMVAEQAKLSASVR